MAIDSEDKRRSVTGIIPPVPDGTIDAADRQHFAGFYRGIAASAPVAVTSRATKGLLLGVYNGAT